MKNLLKDLIGQKLIDKEITEYSYVGVNSSLHHKGECISLQFSNSYIQIENPWEVSNAGDSTKINELFGLKVLSIKLIEGQSFQILFENGFVLSISLKDKDYTTPEAFSYHPNEGEIIVYN